MSFIARRPRRPLNPRIIAMSFLSAAVLFGGVSIAQPAETLAYPYTTIREARCDGASLRTKPKTTAKRKAVLREGAQVRVIAVVKGGSWRTNCDGTVTRGSKWLKISKIGSKSVRQLYGVDHVYAATSLFKTIALNRVAACDDVALRTKPKTTATRKRVLPEGAKVTAVAILGGSSYNTMCGGRRASGVSWYKIKSINGTSVRSLFGIDYVYGAAELFRSPTTTSSAPNPAPTPAPTPTPTPTPTHLEGIDVSHWQGTIDWARVKATGKRFAYLKASEHTSFVDDKYEINRAAAKANGIVVGAYHFARPDETVDDAIREADHFINTARPVSGELLPVLDLEQTGGLGPKKLQNWALAFLNRVYERTGVKGAIYVSPSFWRNEVGDSTILADNGYKVLWVAHWTTASSPSLPAGNWGGNSWTFWQYTSSGSVDGISGRVDLNRYNGTGLKKVRIP